MAARGKLEVATVEHTARRSHITAMQIARTAMSGAGRGGGLSPTLVAPHDRGPKLQAAPAVEICDVVVAKLRHTHHEHRVPHMCCRSLCGCMVIWGIGRKPRAAVLEHPRPDGQGLRVGQPVGAVLIAALVSRSCRSPASCVCHQLPLARRTSLQTVFLLTPCINPRPSPRSTPAHNCPATSSPFACPRHPVGRDQQRPPRPHQPGVRGNVIVCVRACVRTCARAML